MAIADLSTAERSNTSASSAPQICQQPAFWRELLRDAVRPRRGAAVGCLVTSVGGYIVTCVAMYLALQVSVLLVLVLMPFATAFLLRTFIVFHDCTHGSFFASRRANTWVGRICGAMVFAPFSTWRHEHNVHHATSGDLDKRGMGDVPVMTLAEYRAATPRARLGYRLFRNPLIMFGIGPIVAMIIGPRLVSRDREPRFRRSILWTDAAILIVVVTLVMTIGVGAMALIWIPPALMAGSAGIWLFYVQHQFEDVYWRRSEEWNYAEAALRGSSFLDLPAPLAWATGRIGYHHLHHLSSRIPFYNLVRTHRDNDVFHSVPVLTMRDGFRCTRLKLYDEDSDKLITWAEARTAMAVPPCAPAAGPAVTSAAASAS